MSSTRSRHTTSFQRSNNVKKDCVNWDKKLNYQYAIKLSFCHKRSLFDLNACSQLQIIQIKNVVEKNGIKLNYYNIQEKWYS